MNKKQAEIDSNTLLNRRRGALKKLASGSILGGAAASMPNQWIKPVVDAVVLPAHAECTDCTTPEPLLPGLTGVSINVTDTNVSGSVATFQVTISSPDADAGHPITINSLTPSSGSFNNFTPGVQVTAGSPLVVEWISEAGFVDAITGIVLAGMFADVIVGVSGAEQSAYTFILAETGDAP